MRIVKQELLTQDSPPKVLGRTPSTLVTVCTYDGRKCALKKLTALDLLDMDVTGIGIDGKGGGSGSMSGHCNYFSVCFVKPIC